MRLHPSHLDADSLDYLRTVATTSGEQHEGVFVRRWAPWYRGPRAGWPLLLLGGVLAPGVAGFLVWSDFLLDGWFGAIASLQAVLTGVAAFLVLAGLTRLLRPTGQEVDGSFLFADTLHLWDVTAAEIEVLNLHDLQEVDGTGTRIEMTLSTGRRRLVIEQADSGAGLLAYLERLVSLRRAEEALPEPERTEPARLGSRAYRQAVFGLSAGPADLGCEPPPTPRPHRVGLAERAGPWLRGLAAGAAGLAAFFVFGSVDRRAVDEELFARIPATDPGHFRGIDRYLAMFPEAGRHTRDVLDRRDDWLLGHAGNRARATGSPAPLRKFLTEDHDRRNHDRAVALIARLDDDLFEQLPRAYPGQMKQVDHYLTEFGRNGRHFRAVLERRDDWRFAEATAEANQTNSPEPLRRYLRLNRKGRHRERAWAQVGRLYDRVGARLKAGFAAGKGPSDPQLFQAILALVESLKTAPSPVVRIGFRGTIDPEPRTAEQKDVEKRSSLSLLEQKPELARLASVRPDRSAIQPPGEVFDRKHDYLRQQLIFDRLQKALAREIGHDVVKLLPAQGDDRPAIEIGYHVFATGQLSLQTRTTAGQTRTVGLLRHYGVHWTIRVCPGGTNKVFVRKWSGRPLQGLRYLPEPDDPDWAWYAIGLYAAFHDLSSQVIRAFAIDPGPAPSRFGFEDGVPTPARVE